MNNPWLLNIYAAIRTHAVEDCITPHKGDIIRTQLLTKSKSLKYIPAFIQQADNAVRQAWAREAEYRTVVNGQRAYSPRSFKNTNLLLYNMFNYDNRRSLPNSPVVPKNYNNFLLTRQSCVLEYENRQSGGPSSPRETETSCQHPNFPAPFYLVGGAVPRGTTNLNGKRYVNELQST